MHVMSGGEYVMKKCFSIVAMAVIGICHCHGIRAQDIEATSCGPEVGSERSRQPADTSEPTGDLTVGQALELALARNPELAASAWQIKARQALVRQAAVRPNPKVEFEIENFAGSGELDGTDASELALVFEQKVELGGKRSRRERLADLGRDLSEWDYESMLLDLESEVRTRFIDVLAAQDKLGLVEKELELAQKTLEVASIRVRAGKVSPLDETKAKVELSAVMLDLSGAQGNLAAAREQLAATWGSHEARFSTAQGNLERIEVVPPFERLTARLDQNPDVGRWASELRKSDAALSLEQSRSIPDLSIALGVKYENEIDDAAFVGGFSIPIPFFDRNQGAIHAAQIGITQTELRGEAARTKAHTKLDSAYRALVTEHERVIALQETVVPGAREVFEATREGYRQGKLGYLDIVDAQRTLFGVEEQYMDALAKYHHIMVDVERLIGGELGAVE